LDDGDGLVHSLGLLLELLLHNGGGVRLLLVDVVMLLKKLLQTIHCSKLTFLNSKDFKRLNLGDESALNSKALLSHLLATHVGELVLKPGSLLLHEPVDFRPSLFQRICTNSNFVRFVTIILFSLNNFWLGL
jgi:hypothetical protein